MQNTTGTPNTLRNLEMLATVCSISSDIDDLRKYGYHIDCAGHDLLRRASSTVYKRNPIYQSVRKSYGLSGENLSTGDIGDESDLPDCSISKLCG